MHNALSLETAQSIVAAALRSATELSLKPIGVAVYDARGALKAFAAQDGTSLARAQIACAKACGVLGMGIGSRAIAKRAQDAPHFMAAVAHLIPGGIVPVPGGVLIRSAQGDLLGAIGISGDTSDNDEAAAVAAVTAAGLTPEP
jgi:uncharacterized protein GlcG (DUF336 family)